MSSASLSRSVHCPRVQQATAILSSFLQAYILRYLPSITSKHPTLLPDLLGALLQLNTLLVKHVKEVTAAEDAKEVASYRSSLFRFAWDLYETTDDSLTGWALLFLCQFIDSYGTSARLTTRIFCNILHLFKLPNMSVVYRAVSLLAPCRFCLPC